MLVQPFPSSLLPAESDFSLKGREEANPASSRRSSISEESQISQNSRIFEHYREPTILDRPGVVLAIQLALMRGDSYALAYLVRHFGLPSCLRAAAWPILLRSHPYVLRSRSQPPQPLLALEEKTTRRLRGDIGRMTRYRGESLDSELIESTVTNFLLTWGNKIQYETPMVWVADFLISGEQARGTPLTSPGPSSLSSSPTDTFLNGSVSRSVSSSTGSSTGSVGNSISGSSTSSGAAESTVDSTDSNAFTDDDPASSSFRGVDRCVVDEVFTNVMLVMSDSPAAFSEFISIIRTILPGLSEHFEYEGILCGANTGDVWLVWWIRWLGIRSFPSALLGRVWDEYFAFREVEDEATEEVPAAPNRPLLSQDSVIRHHLFNCTMLMKENMPRLLELDLSECRQFLAHIPDCQDVEAVVTEAKAMSIEYMDTKF